MSACVLDVQILPASGRPGDRVSVRVRPSGGSVSSIRLEVVGYGLEEHLAPQGPDWALDATVPYEATPGEYLVDVVAVDATGHALGSSRRSFQVLA